MTGSLRRIAPFGLPLLLLAGVAWTPGPIWGYLGRVAVLFCLSAACGWLLAGTAHPRVEVPAERPEAGDFLEIEAVWRSFWPGFWRVTIQDGDRRHVHEGWFGVGRLRLRWLEGDVRRGLHVYDVRLAYRDPLGLVTRSLPRGARLAVAVRPRAVDLQLRRLASGGEASLRGLLRAPEQREFTGVRRYEAGDRLAQLHWPQTVRTGHLQVRQTLRSGDLLREIVLDTDRADYADPGLFELAVSVAASFALTLARQGHKVSLLAGRCSVRAAQGHQARLMEALTAVELEQRPMRKPGGTQLLFIGPAEAVRSFKVLNPGAMAVTVGGGHGGADLVVPSYPALWQLGRRIRA